MNSDFISPIHITIRSRQFWFWYALVPALGIASMAGYTAIPVLWQAGLMLGAIVVLFWVGRNWLAFWPRFSHLQYQQSQGWLGFTHAGQTQALTGEISGLPNLLSIITVRPGAIPLSYVIWHASQPVDVQRSLMLLQRLQTKSQRSTHAG